MTMPCDGCKTTNRITYGFKVDGGWEYFCSEECLHREHKKKEEYDKIRNDNLDIWPENWSLA